MAHKQPRPKETAGQTCPDSFDDLPLIANVARRPPLSKEEMAERIYPAPFGGLPMNAQEKRAEEVMEYWTKKFHGPDGESVMMTDAEAQEYEAAVMTQNKYRMLESDLGIGFSIDGDEFRRRLEESIKRDERLLVAGGGEDSE